MSEKEVAETNGHSERLSFQDRVAHLKSGYDNSQSVARFLDTKASAVIAAIPIVVALFTLLVNVVKDAAQWRQAFASPIALLLYIFVALLVASVIALLEAAGQAIAAAFRAITPRTSGKTKPSVLFPCEEKFDGSPPDDTFASRVAFLIHEAKENDVFEDYERQIIRMSEIVAQKFGCVNEAIEHLKRFFICAVFVLGLILATTVVAVSLEPSAGASDGPFLPTTNPSLKTS
jgi:hypothetical protein